jgi:hypothetical protein
MKRFRHPQIDAVGACKHCFKGACSECSKDTGVGIADVLGLPGKRGGLNGSTQHQVEINCSAERIHLEPEHST